MCVLQPVSCTSYLSTSADQVVTQHTVKGGELRPGCGWVQDPSFLCNSLSSFSMNNLGISRYVGMSCSVISVCHLKSVV